MEEEQLFDKAVWEGSEALLSKHEKHELHYSSSTDHRLFKGPLENTIKSIIRCSAHPLELNFIIQTDLSIDQADKYTSAAIRVKCNN